MSHSSGSGNDGRNDGEDESRDGAQEELNHGAPDGGREDGESAKAKAAQADPSELGARALGIVPGTSIRIKAPWYGRPHHYARPRPSGEIIPFARRPRPPHSTEKE